MLTTLALTLCLLAPLPPGAARPALSQQPAPPPPPAEAAPPVPPQPPAAPLLAQPARPPQPPPPPEPPRPPRAPRAPEGPPPPASLVNVEVELTITDQTGTGTPEKKTVSLIVSDGNMGRIRASAVARPSERTGNVPTALNVDVTPQLQANGLIQLHLTMFYQPLRSLQAGDPTQTSPTELNQSLSVLLHDGQPLVVSRAADPVTDRRISVEVKAAVLK